jgi:hypothetical protein
MRRLLMMLLMVILAYNASAQTSIGSWVRFPNNALLGQSFKPQLAFAILDDEEMIALRMICPDNYATFDNESRLLIKFEDDSVTTLPIYFDVGVVKDYSTDYDSTLGFIEFYITLTLYKLDSQTKEAIVEDGKKIKKIRVVETNGDINDYDINPNYQQKLIYGLQKSYKDVIAEQKQRQFNASDAGF